MLICHKGLPWYQGLTKTGIPGHDIISSNSESVIEVVVSPYLPRSRAKKSRGSCCPRSTWLSQGCRARPRDCLSVRLDEAVQGCWP